MKEKSIEKIELLHKIDIAFTNIKEKYNENKIYLDFVKKTQNIDQEKLTKADNKLLKVRGEYNNKFLELWNWGSSFHFQIAFRKCINILNFIET